MKKPKLIVNALQEGDVPAKRQMKAGVVRTERSKDRGRKPSTEDHTLHEGGALWRQERPRIAAHRPLQVFVEPARDRNENYLRNIVRMKRSKLVLKC